MTVFDDFHQRYSALNVQWLYAKVILDQNVELFESEHFLDGRAVCLGHLKLGKQSGGVGVKDFVPFATGMVAQGTG